MKNKKKVFITVLILGLLAGGGLISNALKQSSVSEGGLVGYWTFNESDLYDTDIFQDMSGSGNNGTSAETPSYTSDQNGVPSQAMTFNGTTDLVNCGSDTSIDNIFDGGGTVSAWINPSSDGEGDVGRIFDKRAGWTFYVIYENVGVGMKLRLWYDFDGTDGYWTTDSTIISIGEWSHIAVSYDNDAVANNPIFYINGVPYTVASGLSENPTPVGTRVSDAGSTLYLGNAAAGAYTFDGSISDAMLFSSTLSEDEVRQLYLAGRTTARMKVDATNKIVNGDMELNSNWTGAGLTTCEQSTDQKHSGIYSWKNIADGASDSVKSDAFSLVDGHKYRLVAWVYGDGSVSIRSRVRDVTNGINYGQTETTWAASWTQHETTFTATADTANAVYNLYFNGAGTAYIDDVSIVDITNAVTPKLQKGLILDMPLNDRYTEAGSDLVTNGGFDTDTDWALGSDWTIADGVATSAGIANNEMSQDIGLLSNKIYGYSFEITSWTSGTEIRLYYNNGAFQKIVGVNGAATYTGTFVVSGNTNGLIYFGVAGDAIASIDNIVIKELDGTTKDRTPYSNDGTVEGATLKHDGLVNTGAGIAYINQDKAYGTWEFDVNKGADGNTVKVHFIETETDGSESGYAIRFSNDKRIYLRVAGEPYNLFYTAASYILINTDYRIKVTRSLAGVFTVYIKGGTFGWDDWTTVVAGGGGSNPVTNNDYTTSNYLVADLDNGDTISNLKIDGKRHSLANAVQSTGTWTTTGGAYDFDGTNDYISIPDTDDLSFGDGTNDSPFSISAWVNMADASDFQVITKGVYNTDGEWRFYTYSDGTIALALYDENVASCYVGRRYITALGQNIWIHIVATYSGLGFGGTPYGIKLYVNGVEKTCVNWHSNPDSYVAMENLDHDVWIGRYSAYYANGQISRLKVFNRELSSGEVEYLYSSSKFQY